MTCEARRDPVADKLLTPENSAFLLIDYQPTQINSINSMNRAQLIKNVVNVIGLMNTFKIPVILSTVNVKNGRNKDTIAPIKDLLPDVPSYDRTTINAWEDTEFKAAVKQTGRHNLIIAALWTEACLTFPTLDALDEGYDVFPVVDSVGGTSVIAHEAALRRVEQAGAKPTSIPQLACELQRDWQRTDTVPGFTKELVDAGIFLHL
ncbi:hydrolase [Pediococcus inopinatus]|uniref:hydrolase n=1 Tax=Pediococcus inopinatus TaxID=114090 RepID=UPI002A69DD73|nr:hydrolase [Pediococcus inopinatus]WPC17772.1 hydrolase [Pediococcus inopinatus]WPP10056.1 hydrolase [Pediococcus inopinatus]